jgi:hypothetical protein
MKKILLATVLGTGFFATPALADFYIVQDTTTKKCTIVDKKPTTTTTTTTTTVVGGDGKVYTTRTQAESAMKTEKICTTDAR